MTASEPASKEAGLREAIIATCRQLTQRGLTHGTSGNVSARSGQSHCLISPSGADYESLAAADICCLDFEGHWYGHLRPSSEWRFHRDVYRLRPEVNAIVHTHSLHATALACTGRGIPAFHYMVAIAGGSDVRCAPYRTFGSQELSEVALRALEDRKACLLANHGVIALGADLEAALRLAAEVENLAAQYCAALALGNVGLLDDREMQRVIEKFRTYGRQDAPYDGLSFGGERPPA